MNLINLTPHFISIVVGNDRWDVEPSGQVARCSVQAVDSVAVGAIPTVVNTYGEVQGLPSLAEMEEGNIYLVSALVLGRLGSEYKGKVYGLDTGATAIRENGQIVAVTRLVSL